jgi:hypothetical protein
MGRRHQQKDGKMGKGAKSEAKSDALPSDVVKDDAQWNTTEGQSKQKDGRIRNSAKMGPRTQATAGRKHEQKDGKMGKRAKSEAKSGASPSDVVEDDAQ